MKKLRTDEGIVCNGTPHKTSLVRSGYFNMINGYKMPFTCGTDVSGNHIYFISNNHEQIPTWIMIKVVNFSTFIDVLRNSKVNVTHAICKLYSMYDNNNLPNVKLLIGSLHWLRRVRNSCVHNEPTVLPPSRYLNSVF